MAEKFLNISEEDEALFAEAVQGVQPLEGGGRDVPLAVPSAQPQVMPEADYLHDFLRGKFEFALEYTEEFFEGHVRGLDPLVRGKLRAGQYSSEAHVDLHGLNAEQACQALVLFLGSAFQKGQRTVIVVTGRGKNSPDGQSILRQHSRDWFTRDPLKRIVLAFCTARPHDGGGGAFYVLLRKGKKKQGKIRWERGPWEEDLLIGGGA
jgi:DNA-nicking Smr family endonuclease